MLIITDHRLPLSVKRRLTEQGNHLICLPPHPSLPTPVASHPDMLLFFAPDAIYCASDYRKLAREELSQISDILELELRCIDAKLGMRYPDDVPLNAAPVGRHLFCHPTHTAKELCAHPAYNRIPVRQGYAKCSILPVGASALITEDPSIARAARERRIDVLEVHQNAVALKGYSTGFLGGAASFAPFGSMQEILFCGSLDSHPDADQIRNFCAARGFEAISLSDEPLYDVGTMFVFHLQDKGDIK